MRGHLRSTPLERKARDDLDRTIHFGVTRGTISLFSSRIDERQGDAHERHAAEGVNMCRPNQD